MSDGVLDVLRGGLVTSCQAYPGEPMRHPETMAQIAESAVRGGAVGIRAQGVADVSLIHERVAVPQIGLWKVGGDGVFITPTLAHAVVIANVGAEIVAIDGTRRPRPDGRTLSETVRDFRNESSALLMADVGSVADGLAAVEAGVDCLSTTLCGYTDERPKSDGPDLEVLAELVSTVPIPVFAEGRVHTPAQARACADAGAWAVVVGTAITHPATITSWFSAAVGSPQH
ncbi:N-acetylmannosamine-6-phosphate 2-epimerase [Curtobacterium pusillum]|uniref:Putative N-acetylmannosamine-6-phosphate 2-epimerase n=1 Tax=Curtobacterium pusillum TaxID=69373 RepID=A0ABX2MCA6_9MICO|nr:N-acetylmannosamine-6-phosphate 2-epimerase [Curtobacterium pusillum]NUU15148.1 N-acetylmannosamine-6-phosphate 2-epimerase [Curtobacterium pusillum]GLK31524.1 putative N-acetylmannosamine-6-phosphate 2-epimerase [Curtobacterium pusillum]